MKHKDLDHVARILLSMKKPSKQKTPVPTKADLNRKFRMVKEDQKIRIEEVKD